MSEPILTAEVVHDLIMKCLHQDVKTVEDLPANTVIVPGLIRTFAFNTDAIEENRARIKELLGELNPNFRRQVGGGWSFIQMAVDKDDRQWGEQRTAEALLCLGIACSHAAYALPREGWPMMPGGVPYVMIDLDEVIPESDMAFSRHASIIKSDVPVE